MHWNTIISPHKLRKLIWWTTIFIFCLNLICLVSQLDLPDFILYLIFFICMLVLFVGALKNIKSNICWILIFYVKEKHNLDQLAQFDFWPNNYFESSMQFICVSVDDQWPKYLQKTNSKVCKSDFPPDEWFAGSCWNKIISRAEIR